MSGDALSLAIHLTAHNGVSPVLAALSAQMRHLHGETEGLQAKLARGFAIGSAASLAAGAAMIGVLHTLEHAGEELVHVKTLFEAALPPQERMADMAKVTAAAWKEAGQNMRTSASDNVEALHDLYTITGDVDHAIEMLPAFNELKNSLDSAKAGGHATGGNENKEEVTRAIQAFELAGRSTAESLKAVAEEYRGTAIALGSRISGGQLRTQMGTAKDARVGWDDDFLAKVFPALIAGGMGNRAGNMLYMLNSNLNGGVVSSLMQGKAQEKWGLHTEQDELKDKGKFKGFKVGSEWGAKLLQRNPLEWANAFLKHLKDDMGVDVTNQSTMQQLVGEVGRGNGSVKAALDELLLPQFNRQINKEVGNISKVGKDAGAIQDDKDPAAVWQSFWAQWKNVKEALGEPLVQPFMDNVLKPVASFLKDTAQWAAANPGKVGEIGKALMVVAAGLTALGIALGAAALVALLNPIGLAFVAIAAGAAAMALYWPQVKAFFVWMGGDLRQQMNGLVEFGKAFVAAISALPGMVSGAIWAAVESIGATFSSALSGLRSYLPGFLGGTPATTGASPQAQAAPPPAGVKATTVNSHVSVNIDGKKVAQAVTSQQVAAGTYPTSVGSSDGRASYAAPGTSRPIGTPS